MNNPNFVVFLFLNGLLAVSCRCATSARLLEDRGLDQGPLNQEPLDQRPCHALAGLPGQVKVLASEMDNVLSLEELAMRFLHHVQQQSTGVSTGGSGTEQVLPSAPVRKALVLRCCYRSACRTGWKLLWLWGRECWSCWSSLKDESKATLMGWLEPGARPDWGVLLCCRSWPAASQQPPKEPAGVAALPPGTLPPLQPGHVHQRLPQTLPPAGHHAGRSSPQVRLPLPWSCVWRWCSFPPALLSCLKDHCELCGLLLFKPLLQDVWP